MEKPGGNISQYMPKTGDYNLHYAICTNRVIFFALRVSYWLVLWFSSYNFCTKLCHETCTLNLCSHNLHYNLSCILNYAILIIEFALQHIILFQLHNYNPAMCTKIFHVGELCNLGYSICTKMNHVGITTQFQPFILH